ncbi:hypothetical protein O1611_g2927 [Lasiodiplodia mahajangana]|uniref:Uncharacterized protein n=1 Tax=Lasiodiplodia mahajangana TaxID=1108764 RepID=A0ACC2JT66_9PEZI|nr:hypothetical protein O1611_g2927 [Lasiodiplodia mahajangana]
MRHVSLLLAILVCQTLGSPVKRANAVLDDPVVSGDDEAVVYAWEASSKFKDSARVASRANTMPVGSDDEAVVYAWRPAEDQ